MYSSYIQVDMIIKLNFIFFSVDNIDILSEFIENPVLNSKTNL